MKKFFLFYLVFLFVVIKSQIKEDTLYLEKDKYHRVFVEKNKASNYYNYISDFKEFKSVNSTKKIEHLGIKSKWLRIYQHNNHYFLYAPCDWMYDLKYVIEDNKIQVKSAEIVEYKIYLKKRKKDEIFIRYRIPNSKNKKLLIIKPFDKSLGIFKFVSIDGSKTTEYFMINAENYKSFNIIVNECIEKTKEFDFK